jgi:hypothetical protein
MKFWLDVVINIFLFKLKTIFYANILDILLIKI